MPSRGSQIIDLLGSCVQQIRNELGVSEKPLKGSMNYAWGPWKLLRVNGVGMSQVICAWVVVVWWCILAVGQGLCFWGCKRGCEAWKKADLCLAWVAQHTESIAVQSWAGPGTGNQKEWSSFRADGDLFAQQKLITFRQETFQAAVAPFQELIRAWSRAQALNTLYLGSEWQLFLLL